MFLGSDVGEWFVVAVLFVLTMILAAWVVAIEKERKRRLAKTKAKERHQQQERSEWVFPENDGWEFPCSSGEFIKSWYLKMDILEEGLSELGTRYRILKDNDTGVLYYYDRVGMTPLVKDYARTRYA